MIALEEPTATSLERHRRLYGSECVELPDENRDALELRADGLSVPEIARVLRISVKAAKGRLTAGESIPVPAI